MHISTESAAQFNPEQTRINMEKGLPVILVPDQRWARCDMKTIGLTANILANQQAKEKGAKEALFVRDGVIMEGTPVTVIDGVPVGSGAPGPVTRTLQKAFEHQRASLTPLTEFALLHAPHTSAPVTMDSEGCTWM